jgi:hypothetical protein
LWCSEIHKWFIRYTWALGVIRHTWTLDWADLAWALDIIRRTWGLDWALGRGSGLGFHMSYLGPGYYTSYLDPGFYTPYLGPGFNALYLGPVFYTSYLGPGVYTLYPCTARPSPPDGPPFILIAQGRCPLLFLPAPGVNGGSREHGLEGQLSSLRHALAASGSKSQELAAANQALQTGLEAAELAQHNAEDRLGPLQQRPEAEAARANNLGVNPTPLAFQN